MKTKKTAHAIAAALLVGFAAMASAQANELYAGLAYTEYNVDTVGETGNVKPTATTVKVGYAYNKHLAVEARFAVPMSDSRGIKVDNHIAMYAKGMLPLGQGFRLYGLAGVNTLTLASAGRGPTSNWATEKGASVGAGMDFVLSDSVSLNVEWASHFSNASSVSLGVQLKF